MIQTGLSHGVLELLYDRVVIRFVRIIPLRSVSYQRVKREYEQIGLLLEETSLGCLVIITGSSGIGP